MKEDRIDKAIGLLLDWLEATDYIDCIIHTDRFLRDMCNCDNELQPCRICERLTHPASVQ